MAGKLEDIQVRPGGTARTATARPKRDAPPRQAPPEKKAAAATPYRAGIIQAGMTRFYGMLGMLLMLIKPELGMVIVRNAENLAKSWEVLARSDAKVRAVLYKMISGTGWTTVATAHLPIFLVLGKEYGPERLATALAGLIANNPDMLIVRDIDLNADDLLASVGDDQAPPAAA